VSTWNHFYLKIAKHKLAHGWRPNVAGLRKYLRKSGSWPKVKLQGERVRAGKGDRGREHQQSSCSVIMHIPV